MTKLTKKAKIAIIIIVSVLVLAGLVLLIIGDFGKTTYKISEIHGFKGFPTETSAMELKEPGEEQIEISDTEDIKTVMDIVSNATFEKKFGYKHFAQRIVYVQDGEVKYEVTPLLYSHRIFVYVMDFESSETLRLKLNELFDKYQEETDLT